MIRAVGMERERCDVVLGGGIYAAARQHNPLLIDSFTLTLHRTVPGARVSLPDFEPAVGAYLLAAEQGGEKICREGDAPTARRLAQSYSRLEIPNYCARIWSGQINRIRPVGYCKAEGFPDLESISLKEFLLL